MTVDGDGDEQLYYWVASRTMATEGAVEVSCRKVKE